MALTSYGELQTAIGNWLGRPGDGLISPVIPDWIALCEARVNRELRLRSMETRATAIMQERFVGLPAGFLEMRSLRLNTNPPQALEMAAPDFIDRVRAGAAPGRPRVFAIIDNEIELAPAPDAAYAAEMIYWKRFDALSGSVASNWLLANAPASISSVRWPKRRPIWATMSIGRNGSSAISLPCSACRMPTTAAAGPRPLRLIPLKSR